MINKLRSPIFVLFLFSVVSAYVCFVKYKINNDFIVYSEEESIPEPLSLLSFSNFSK